MYVCVGRIVWLSLLFWGSLGRHKAILCWNSFFFSSRNWKTSPRRTDRISVAPSYVIIHFPLFHGYIRQRFHKSVFRLSLNESFMGRDSSVGIETRYGLDGPGIESRWEARFSAPVQTGPGAHPASCTMGIGSFPRIKLPERGADHPPPLSAEVMKG